MSKKLKGISTEYLFHLVASLVLLSQFGYNFLTVFNVFLLGVNTALTAVNFIEENMQKKG
ncbi:MAG: hypothetical protein QM613_01915 [Micrococcaceae bacterium]